MLLFVSVTSWSQNSNTSIPLIGDNAPSFTTASTIGTVNFPSDAGKHWKILFSHPADFTPVCSSEIIELAGYQNDFNNLDAKLFVVSADGVDNHKQWVTSMEGVKYKNKNTEKINFALLDDKDHSIAKKYGMIHPNSNSTKDVRGVFIIDPSNKIRAVFFYPMEVGRNLDEIKRTLLALQETSKDHVMTPANWNPGDDVLIPYTKSDNSSEKDNLASKEPGVYQVSWYMWLKKTQ